MPRSVAVTPVPWTSVATARCNPIARCESGKILPIVSSQCGSEDTGMNTPEMNDNMTATNGPSVEAMSAVGHTIVTAMPSAASDAVPTIV